jgi:hypothetical protein
MMNWLTSCHGYIQGLDDELKIAVHRLVENVPVNTARLAEIVTAMEDDAKL